MTRIKNTTQDFTAENTFSEWIDVVAGFINVTIESVGTGCTLTVQKRFKAEDGTAFDVAAYTSIGAKDLLYEPESAVQYRIGVKTGGYGSGTATGRISQ